MEKTIAIQDLNLRNNELKALTLLVNARDLKEVGAVLDLSYTGTWQKLEMWIGKGWIRKHKSPSGSVYYLLNQDKLQV